MTERTLVQMPFDEVPQLSDEEDYRYCPAYTVPEPLLDDLPPSRVDVLVLDGDLVQDEPFLIVPEAKVYRTLCDGTTVEALTFTTTDGDVVRFYVNPYATKPNAMATRMWAALNPGAPQQIKGSVVVMGAVEGFDYHVPVAAVRAAKGLSP
jgi:hypothetical protein